MLKSIKKYLSLYINKNLKSIYINTNSGFYFNGSLKKFNQVKSVSLNLIFKF